jgi:hypothetical protein
MESFEIRIFMNSTLSDEMAKTYKVFEAFSVDQANEMHRSPVIALACILLINTGKLN